MNTLIISDLHLTERKQDHYRWAVFSAVRELLKTKKIADLFILGDLLDRKDRHPAELVNQLIDEIFQCSRLSKVTLLKGNHDYLKPESPFLAFIKHLPNVRWIDTPVRDHNMLWLPHSRIPEEEWKGLDFSDLHYVFMHQSVIGSQVSNMFEMNHGLNLHWLTSRTNAKIYSGDIHVPQTLGALTYIGTPHPVAFGDDYQPRMLWLNQQEEISIPLKSIQRLTIKITSSKELERYKNNKTLTKGDQIKVKVLLSNKELSNWTETKQLVKEWCQFNEIELFDITLERLETQEQNSQNSTVKFKTIDPHTAMQNFIHTEKLDSYLTQIGTALLNAAIQEKVCK